ncbi:hypothetical protein EST38_g9622 [Candolleomyces aberdarensis]|uniref:Uncharacterized protein n=1 Tax=Candolleomyces aberdarensis TaxID=2316362 RepID=A0A4Q2DBM9_9AGAR|nr:hypothetical protein EST38_g9622 [Candolleomyces aberdarensis]
MRNDDQQAKRLARDAAIYAERSGLTAVRCGLIGSRCTEVHLVPVPVDNGYHEAPRPFDLKYELYLSVDTGRNSHVVELDKFMKVFPRVPDDFIGTPFQWVLFHSYTDKATENTLVKTFPAAEAIEGPVHGSYLVVKTDADGVVRDTSQDDIMAIQDIVVQSLD